MVGKVLEFGCSSEIFALSSASSIDTKGDLCDCSHSGSVSDAHMALWSQWMRRSCNTQVCCNTDCFCCNCDIFILFWTTHKPLFVCTKFSILLADGGAEGQTWAPESIVFVFIDLQSLQPTGWSQSPVTLQQQVKMGCQHTYFVVVSSDVQWLNPGSSLPQRLSLSFCLGHHALQNCKNRVVLIFGWLNCLKRKHTDVDSRITEDFFLTASKAS